MLRDLNNTSGSGARNNNMNNNSSMNKANNPHARAVRILMQELKSLQEDPMEGFKCKLLQDSDLFHWEVAIFGPPDTPYSGGYFKALMSFPTDYPFSPPSVKFLNKIWHPNIYHSGEVCISILHPPNDDPQSGELPQERWNPAQSVRTVLMSIISLLNEPNTASPANVDASVMYRRWKESAGKDKEYEKIIRQNVEESLKEAAKDGVDVPKNADEYTAVSRTVRHTEKRKLGEEDFYAEVDWYADDEGAHGHGTAGGGGNVDSAASRDFSDSGGSNALLYDADDESSQVGSTPVSAVSSRKSLTTLRNSQQRPAAVAANNVQQRKNDGSDLENAADAPNNNQQQTAENRRKAAEEASQSVQSQNNNTQRNGQPPPQPPPPAGGGGGGGALSFQSRPANR